MTQALDISRITDGTENQVAKDTLQALQDHVTFIRTADNPQSQTGDRQAQAPSGDQAQAPGDQSPPAGDRAVTAKPLTRAQTTLMEAIQGFDKADNVVDGIVKFGPTFETAIKQADEDFTARMTEMSKDYEANKPAVERADAAMTSAEQGLTAAIKGIKNPEEQQMAAFFALEYLKRGADKSGIDVDKAFKSLPAVRDALKGINQARAEHEPILTKINDWRTNTAELMKDRFMTRVAYGAALDAAGSPKAQDMYKEGFGIMGLEVPKALQPKKDPNIRQASADLLERRTVQQSA